MSLATLRVIETIAAIGPVKLSRCELVGDAAYTAGGSYAFEELFQTTSGNAGQTVLDVKPVGNNGDLLPEYTAAIALTDCVCSAGSDTFTTEEAHNLKVGDAVEFSATVLPTTAPLASTRYYVIASGLTDTVFKVSATVGGSTINPGSAGTAVQFQRKAALFMRVPSTGAENATADLSGTSIGILVTSY